MLTHSDNYVYLLIQCQLLQVIIFELTFLSFSFQHILLLERLFLAYYSWNFHLPFSNLKGIITGKTEYTCIIFYEKHFYLDTYIFLFSYIINIIFIIIILFLYS